MNSHDTPTAGAAAPVPKLPPMPIAVCKDPTSIFEGNTIALSHMDSFELAERFAKDIHHAVIERDLAMADGRARRECVVKRIQEIRASIRSIADRYNRRGFVQTIGWHLKRLTDARELRGRAYVARVRAVEAERAAEMGVAA